MARLRLLQCGCPIELQLEAFCDGDSMEECWVHWELYEAGLHHRNEWFKDGERAQRIIKQMRDRELKAEGTPANVIMQSHKRLGRVFQFIGRTPRGWARKTA